MAAERSFVMVKPDGVQRGLVGRVVTRIEERGLRLVAMKMLRIDRALAERHYGEHRGKPFFEGLVKYITEGPVVAMVVEGPGAVEAVRALMGATHPLKSPPGSIRGDYALDIERNIVHGSDGPESAVREIGLFFGEKEIVGQ